MLSEITGIAGADAFGADGSASPPHHWALDDIVWSPDALAAAAAPLGSAGGALRPATLDAAMEAPKSRGLRRKTQRDATCTALGCSEALYALGPYYLRTRLCPTHLRAEQLVLAQDGPTLRFCQARHFLNPRATR